jgi:hypothetical protein
MGHVRLGSLPQTRSWKEVVGLLYAAAPVDDVAAASAQAAEGSIGHAASDPALGHSIWLLTQLPLAARTRDFPSALQELGLKIDTAPTLLSIVGAFADAVDRQAARIGGRTDLGELTQQAAAESLTTTAGQSLPSLFSPTPEEVRRAFARLTSREGFGRLAREFFARLTHRYLDYYLSRELSNHVGPGLSLPTIAAHTDFKTAIDLHCREASRIVEAFAGAWYGKTQFEGGITPDKARRFAFVALRKIVSELKQRSGSGG